MAVVKANYQKGSSSGAIRYAIHREAETEQGSYRTGFTNDREGLTTQEAVDELKQYEQEGKGYTYHIVLNPGDGQETPVDLEQWTRDTMQKLEEKHGREIPYVAVVHNDHSGHAHVHVVAHTERTLNRPELNHVRQEATREFDRQKEMHRDVSHTVEGQHEGRREGGQVKPQLKEGPGKEFAEYFARRHEYLKAQESGQSEGSKQDDERSKWKERAAKLLGNTEGAAASKGGGGSGQEREDEAKPKKQRQIEFGR